MYFNTSRIVQLRSEIILPLLIDKNTLFFSWMQYEVCHTVDTIVRMPLEGPASRHRKIEKIAKIGGVLYRYWYYLNLLLINMLRYLAVFRC